MNVGEKMFSRRGYQCGVSCNLPFGMLCARLILSAGLSGFGYTSHAETLAGTRIANTASITYSAAGSPAAALSNTDTIIVAERLDVALVRSSAPLPPSTAAIDVLLTNSGNGQEAFALSARTDGDARPSRFAIDVDGDGQYDAARDTLLADAVTPALAPGATLALLLLGAADGGFDGTQTTIVARAVTGVGAPGTTFAGLGDGGGDAVVGPTGAQAEVSVALDATGTPTLAKTQSVLAPDGTARAIRGAVISYTLRALFTGPAAAARIDDPLPAGTAYVPGSLLLDGQALSDAADADAGQADAAAIGVALGDIAAAAVRTVQFQVRIQ